MTPTTREHMTQAMNSLAKSFFVRNLWTIGNCLLWSGAAILAVGLSQTSGFPTFTNHVQTIGAITGLVGMAILGGYLYRRLRE